MADYGMKFVEAARKYVGVKFVHRGRTKFGLDCAGLIMVSVNNALGTNYDNQDYPKNPSCIEMKKTLELYLTKVPKEELHPGDVLWIKDTIPAASAVHVGFYTDKNTIIHCHTDFGVIEHNLDTGWYNKIIGVYRYLGGD